MSNTTKSTQFLLLFHHALEGPDLTPEQMQEVLGKWMAWMRGMNARGEFAGTNRLQETGRVLRGPGGAEVTDGPFTEAKEIVGGYILINAPDLDAATAIARGCPGLELRRTTVEVRPIAPLPPL